MMLLHDHKTHGEWKIYSRNTVIDYKTQGECKIQLKMTNNFISSKDSGETSTMQTRSDNIEIMWVIKQMKPLKNILNLFCKDIKII